MRQLVFLALAISLVAACSTASGTGTGDGTGSDPGNGSGGGDDGSGGGSGSGSGNSSGSSSGSGGRAGSGSGSGSGSTSSGSSSTSSSGGTCSPGDYPCTSSGECCAGMTCGPVFGGSACCTVVGHHAVAPDNACCSNGPDTILADVTGVCCNEQLYGSCTLDSSCCEGHCDPSRHVCCRPSQGDCTSDDDCCTGLACRPVGSGTPPVPGKCVQATCDTPGIKPCSTNLDCCRDQLCAPSASDPTLLCRRPGQSQDPPCTSDAECADGLCQPLTGGARCCVADGFSVGVDGSSPSFECCSEWANGSGPGSAVCDGNCGPRGVVCIDPAVCCSGSCTAGVCD